MDDLRGREGGVLRYPGRALVVVAGLPGAGKSTLLRRVYGLTGAESESVREDGVEVLDSQQARNRLARWLWWSPYPLWRPLVHLWYLAGMWAALRRPGAVVLHDCGTRRMLLLMLCAAAGRLGREVHLVMIDVPPALARAGQYRRGRLVGGRSFATHCRRWTALTDAVRHSPGTAVPGVTSAVLLDRTAAARVAGFAFGAHPVDSATR
ncbi:AAA family ATPase [Allonocardiopsis opalescens]|uniref:AAA domain-containing protein n=1 Tax=Allonocardiopsis opalescens TaxID=1144618 RepID=A0A2T0PS82_9ACTN|nr:AAA family ATPase [Allonocardiopsis opalescens]PRX91760.1 AAA domain-containing protein [Allonocardiopsis opalescens]